MKPTWTRREVLATGAAALAAGTFAPTANAARKAPRNYKKAVKYGMVKTEGSVEDKFRLLKKLGFDGVELDSPAEFDKEEVLEAIRTTGLQVCGVVDSVHWRFHLSDPDANVRKQGREGLETALRDAHDYGASTVLLVPAVVHKDVSYADAYTRSQKEIRQVLPLAAELRVAIAFENVWNHFLLSPLEAARYVDEFSSPWVGWYLDVGNIVNYGWPQHWVSALGKRILKLDMKEFSRSKRNDEGLWKGFQVEIMEGDCEWSEVMAELDKVGYFERTEGWGTAEVAGGDEARLADIAARMDQAFRA